MKHLPPLQTERLRLSQRLESDKQKAREDIAAMNAALSPLAAAHKMVRGVSEALETANIIAPLMWRAKLGKNRIPQHPLAQIVVPFLFGYVALYVARKVRNNPKIQKIKWILENVRDIEGRLSEIIR